MSILKLNNKIITLGGSIVNYTPPLATKGDLINMDLDGNGNKTYRVLKCNGKVAEVVGMIPISNTAQCWDEDNTTTIMGSLTIAKYADSDLDIFLNTTWYGTLSNIAKNAIVSQTINQDAWYPSAEGSPVYTGIHGRNSANESEYSISKYPDSVINIGSRNIYALSIQDIIDYLSDESVRIDKTMILRNTNVWKMFWNTETMPYQEQLDNAYSFWLRSARASSTSEHAYVVNSWGGSLAPDKTNSTTHFQKLIRPAFCIDLSKIPFTKTTEVIS